MRLTPVTRRELIKRLRNLGWDGPLSGGKHQFMVKGAMKLPFPNPHGGVLSVGMVSEILKETGISREEWLSANPATASKSRNAGRPSSRSKESSIQPSSADFNSRNTSARVGAKTTKPANPGIFAEYPSLAPRFFTTASFSASLQYSLNPFTLSQ